MFAVTYLIVVTFCESAYLKRKRRQVQNCVGSQCSQSNIDVGDLFGVGSGGFNPFNKRFGPGAAGFGGFNGGQGRGFFGGGFGNNFGGGHGQHNLAGAGLPKAQPTQNCVGSQCQQRNVLGNSGAAGGLGHHNVAGGGGHGLGHHNAGGAGLTIAQPTQNCVGSQCQQDNVHGNLGGLGLAANGLGFGFGPNGLGLGNNGFQEFGLGSDGFHVRRKREVRFVDDIMKKKK